MANKDKPMTKHWYRCNKKCFHPQGGISKIFQEGDEKLLDDLPNYKGKDQMKHWDKIPDPNAVKAAAAKAAAEVEAKAQAEFEKAEKEKAEKAAAEKAAVEKAEAEKKPS